VTPFITEPEFCPNQSCRFHDPDVAASQEWYVLHGHFYTQCRGWIQRFRCNDCGTSCSTQTFSVHYWTHYTNDLAWLLQYLYTCGGLRQTARMAGVTHRVIQNRFRRLARNALAVMDTALEELELPEDLAMDGFESYTRSHYHPNNITHLTGCESQFVYAAVHTLFRRKGSMSAAQRIRRSVIDRVWRPPTTVGEDCAVLLSDLAPAFDAACASREDVTLHTDEHIAYPGAVRSSYLLRERLLEGTLVHAQTSSKSPRTTANPLFPVNYVDRQMRKNLAEYVRKTVRQGREVNSQMERMAIFMVLHNFATPHRISDHAHTARCQTHAQQVGLVNKRVIRLLRRMTSHRHVYTHTVSAQMWIRRIWLHLHRTPPIITRRKNRAVVRPGGLGPAALPRYLLA
jgi:transposase-like protein